MKARILVTGLDPVLITSRALLLSNTYEPVSMLPGRVLPCLRETDFDLLLVCHSIPFDEASSLIRTAHREFPYLCIVRLLAPGTPPVARPVAHAVVTVEYNPEVWLRVVERLLAPNQKTAFS